MCIRDSRYVTAILQERILDAWKDDIHLVQGLGCMADDLIVQAKSYEMLCCSDIVCPGIVMNRHNFVSVLQ